MPVAAGAVVSSPPPRSRAASQASRGGMTPGRGGATAPNTGMQLIALLLITLIVPLAIPILNAWRAETPLPPTYLPALEGPRERDRFDAVRVSDLRYLQPGYVAIGDSMAGSR